MIAEARLKAGMTQRDLAARIGVHKITISQWERGDRAPSFRNIHNLAKALKLDEGAVYKWFNDETRQGARHHQQSR